MMLEIARMEDLEAICALYESTCAQMQAAGLNQWSWGEYPSRDIVREDLEAGRTVDGDTAISNVRRKYGV